ncbi:MAG: hypothetical protein ACK40X_10215, partial [Armatimonadota bacterium]
MSVVIFAVAMSVFLGVKIVKAQRSREIAFYVATSGNDAWSGRLASPNRKKTDGPFATLQRA